MRHRIVPNVRLRNASDSLLTDLELLQQLESEKRELEPASERFVELARQIEELAAHVQEMSSQQRESGEELHEMKGSEAAHVTIAEVPPRPITEILTEWRDAERRASEAAPGSLGAAQARADATRLRAEYQRAHHVATEPLGPKAPLL